MKNKGTIIISIALVGIGLLIGILLYSIAKNNNVTPPINNTNTVIEDTVIELQSLSTYSEVNTIDNIIANYLTELLSNNETYIKSICNVPRTFDGDNADFYIYSAYKKGINNVLYYFINGAVIYSYMGDTSNYQPINILIEKSGSNYRLSFLQDGINIYNYANEYEVNKNLVIDTNLYNKFINKNISNDDFYIYYIQLIQHLMVNNPVKAYTLLSATYKNSFGSYGAFNANRNSIINKLSAGPFASKISKKEDYTQIELIMATGRTLIIYEKYPLEITFEII